MPIIANTYQTYQARGIREDLGNVIYDISPEDTPAMSNFGRGKAANTFFEWQTDQLATATSANAFIEGDDLTSFSVSAPTTRVGNYTQIVRKDVIVAGTMEAVDKAGRKGELAYQMAKRSKELKRDMETIILENTAAAVGATGTARRTASLGAWIRTNVSVGAAGANPAAPNPAPTAARTDGTLRPITEQLLRDVLRLAWNNGASPKLVMVGATNKQAISATFTGIATRTFYQTAPKVAAIIGAADVYVSDFGTLSVVPNRFQRARDAWVLDPEYAELAFLRPFQTVELAKTGDAEKRMILAEFGLKVTNELAHGLIADLS